MPKRVEHITENGVKRSGVQGANNIDLWKSFIRLLGIHGTISFTCAPTVSRRRESTIQGTTPLTAWRGLNRRVVEDDRYTKRDIKVQMEKEAFLAWYIKGWFPRCRVDRKDNEKGYALDNIQLISLKEHNYKLREDRLEFLGIKEPDGMRYVWM